MESVDVVIYGMRLPKRLRIISYFIQLIKVQIDQDSRLHDLAYLMCDMFSFVNNIKCLSARISVIEGTIRKLLTQTVECTMFIHQYNGYGFSGKLLAIFVQYTVERCMQQKERCSRHR